MHVFIASDLFLGDWQKSIKEVKVCSGLSTIVLVEEEEEELGGGLVHNRAQIFFCFEI
jgi:hypothetical protein